MTVTFVLSHTWMVGSRGISATKTEPEQRNIAAVAGLDYPRVFVEGSSKGLGDITTFGKQSGSAMLFQKAG